MEGREAEGRGWEAGGEAVKGWGDVVAWKEGRAAAVGRGEVVEAAGEQCCRYLTSVKQQQQSK